MAYDPSRTDLRLKIATWPADAPRGAVSRFCRDNNVSREWFYATRRRLLDETFPQALTPRSSRPATSPGKTTAMVESLAIHARARLLPGLLPGLFLGTQPPQFAKGGTL